MSAAGKVCTGFSLPYVGTYAASQGAVTYSSVQQLARGVEVSIEAESSDASKFYADNVVAETVAGQFTNGTLTLTVDGLFQAAEKLIQGLDTADTAGWVSYDKNQSTPFVGVGFIVRYLTDGVEKFTPILLPKCAFKPQTLSAATQGEEIDFQTQELEATIFRDDTEDASWKYVGADYTTEALALAALQTKMGVSPVTT